MLTTKLGDFVAHRHILDGVEAILILGMPPSCLYRLNRGSFEELIFEELCRLVDQTLVDNKNCYYEKPYQRSGNESKVIGASRFRRDGVEYSSLSCVCKRKEVRNM